MPASAQSTTSGEKDSVSVIYKVGYNVEGVSSGALVDASNKSPGTSQMSVMASPRGERMVELGCQRVGE